MEYKSLKTSVFSLDTAFCESAEQAIDVDFTLPEYYPDVSKILKCRAVSRVVSKGISGSNVLIEGCVTVTVIYCGSDNCISSYEYQYPFSKNFDTGIDTDGCILKAKSKCEYINCRAVTSRKIDVHGAAGIYVTLSRRNITEVISDIDNSDVELLRGNVPATMPIGCNDKYLSIEEEIELGGGQPDIQCLIRYDADAYVTDNKILAGKAVVKGDMGVKILYSSENGAVHTVRCTLPFSQMLEMDGITDQCTCESKVYVACLEIKPRISASGESRSFLLNAKLLITSDCCCNNDIDVILDAYSRKYETNVSKNDICFSKIHENIHENFNCKKNFDFTGNSINAISDIWCDVKIENVVFNSDEMRITGAVTASVIAADGDNNPCFYEKIVDFDYTHPINTQNGTFKCTPEITVAGISYTITGTSNVELRIELNISAAIYECCTVPLITDMVLNNDTVKKPESSAMILYFADGGENVWDIAHKYFASVEEIRKINQIDENILKNDKMLLIPNN